MFFRYALQQMPTLFCVCEKMAEKRATYREARCATRFSNKNLFRKGGLKKNASTPKIKQGCGSANDAVGQLAAHPNSTKDPPRHSRVREHQKPRYTPHVSSASSASKKRSSRNYRSFRPLRSCAVGNAEDVRLRFYRQFRLCFTTTDFGGRKGIGLSPYPYQISTRKESLNGQPRH